MATSIFAASQSSARQHGAIAGINITPLVDVMRVLLVIFMVTMPLRMDALRFTLPGDVRQHTLPPAEPVQLQVQANGSTLLDDVRVEQVDLLEELRAQYAQAPKAVLALDGADDADYRAFTAALAAARNAGFAEITIRR